MMVNVERRKNSKGIFKQLQNLIPGGVSSPVRAFTDLPMTPIVIERGKGDLIWDSDGNQFIDYCGSWGPLILGHADARIIKAIVEQLEKGSTFGAATQVEHDLAAKIISHMPSIEKIRFVSSGTEATMSALRLARGVTGRSRLLKFDGNYHGHADPFLIKAGSGLSSKSASKGVPEGVVKESTSLPYNDLETARSFLQNNLVAAVIVEPIAGNMGLIPAQREFLEMLREETQKQNALLIFDEVITGLRLGLSGAQGALGIKPDLTCLGKIIGGGLPAAAFGGKREIMDELAPLGEVYQAGTLSGNPLAMRAGLETLTILEQEGTYERLQEKTKLLTDPIKEAIGSLKQPMCLHQIGSCFTLFFGIEKASCKTDLDGLDHEKFKHYYQFLFERGLFFPPSPYETSFISLSHSKKHLEMTRDLILEYCTRYL